MFKILKQVKPDTGAPSRPYRSGTASSPKAKLNVWCSEMLRMCGCGWQPANLPSTSVSCELLCKTSASSGTYSPLHQLVEDWFIGCLHFGYAPAALRCLFTSLPVTIYFSCYNGLPLLKGATIYT